MARGGDGVTPTFLGEPFLDKPSPRCEKCDQACGDYMLLGKYDGTWKITQILWQSHPPKK